MDLVVSPTLLCYCVPWNVVIVCVKSLVQKCGVISGMFLLCRYNALFGLLINVRQAQVTLQRCWAQQMTHKGSEHRLNSVWQLRLHMAFFIDNIQYYVQVDVIESQFSLLLESIRSTHDFESIQQAHCNFISSIFRQLFLQMPSVSTTKVN